MSDLTSAFAADAEGLEWAVREFCRVHGEPAREATVTLPDQLADDGAGESAALSTLLDAVVRPARRLGEPGFFAHMDPPTPWVAWAAALWAAGLNQNLLHVDTAPVARDLENTVIGWLAPAFGMSGGHLVPGSTVANLTALWAARDLRGVDTVVTAPTSHLSIRKAAHLLGLRVVELAVDADGRADPDRLPELDHAAVVLTAGTVAAGLVDPLRRPSGVGWVHVDAAWGGPLRLSQRHSAILDGIEQADSVSVSAHKWLFQPKESAMVLFADAEQAHTALSFGGGYLAVPNVGLLGSHGTTALPLAATLLAWGRSGVAARIDHCMDLARRLTDRIEREPRLELRHRPQTGVVLWRVRGQDTRAVRANLRDAFVSLTELDGQTWLRSVAANPMADPELVVDRVLAAAP
nr:pyridoxal-dependent decarboxylase [Kibdelosporangium sp. MJ126-NF4]CEL23097.1 Siderophore biosynthesis L-2,4-diaminobutyrate decarboxylase [Kibdelosporangium sp. MJ126-NF4]CTQ90234.1 Siderophore biosynthesis L-2,4-diaminobutyrate decarboxylase [Kibdelosporangium sp. MJ126-NF4]